MATAEKTTTFEVPGASGSPVEVKVRYDNFIGGEWVPPSTGEYRENPTPRTGEPFCEVAHSARRGCRPRARCGACREGRVG